MAVAPLTPDAIVVYNRMDWMIVDARTNQESISAFFRKCKRHGNNLFDTCSLCNEVCCLETIPCQSCMNEFCVECVQPHNYRESCSMLECPSCNRQSMSPKRVRFAQYGEVKLPPLVLFQLSHSNKQHPLLLKLCECCGTPGAVSTCLCGLGTRYCGRTCQKKHWPVHKTECLCIANNFATLKLSEWKKGEGSFTVKFQSVSSRFHLDIFDVETLALLLNSAMARRTDALIKENEA
jgi:hypothetical protein